MIETAELDDRIVKCEKILAADANSQIFAALAEAYRKKGELSKARGICQTGLKIHPDYASARIVMAKIHMANEDYDQAWDELQLSIKASGRSRAIDILESEILIKRGKRNDAKAILQRLYVSDPGDETIKNLMIMLGEEKRSAADADPVMPRISSMKNSSDSISLEEAINIIRVTPRVLGTVAVDERGMVIYGRFDGSYDKDEIAALAREIFDSSDYGSRKISLGKAKEILIEAKSLKLWFIGRERYLLVILTRDDVSMGSLKLKIEDLLQRVEYYD